MINPSYCGNRTKSRIINATIGRERMVALRNRIFHFLMSCAHPCACSECSQGDATSNASYPASAVACFSTSGLVLPESYLMRAFSEAKFTFASLTHLTCLRDFSMRLEQLEQCIPPISKVAIAPHPLTPSPFEGEGGLFLLPSPPKERGWG